MIFRNICPIFITESESPMNHTLKNHNADINNSRLDALAQFVVIWNVRSSWKEFSNPKLPLEYGSSMMSWSICATLNNALHVGGHKNYELKNHTLILINGFFNIACFFIQVHSKKQWWTWSKLRSCSLTPMMLVNFSRFSRFMSVFHKYHWPGTLLSFLPKTRVNKQSIWQPKK